MKSLHQTYSFSHFISKSGAQSPLYLFSNPSFSPLLQSRQLSTQSDSLLALNTLTNIPGSKKKRRRWGRGVGSGRGKLCGYGHQKSLSTPMGFEGGQTPLYKRLPKIGMKNPNKMDLQPVNLYKIQEFIDMGRLQVPPEGLFLTMRDLLYSGIISKVGDGVKLLSKGKAHFRTPIHIEVTAASAKAIAAVEACGGTVTCSHFNKLALRALVKPLKFELLPRRARPPPKKMQYYLDVSKCGYMSPEIQQRNLKLFGAVTSEEALRAEHDAYMAPRREEYRLIREERRRVYEETLAQRLAKAEQKAERRRQRMAGGQ